MTPDSCSHKDKTQGIHGQVLFECCCRCCFFVLIILFYLKCSVLILKFSHVLHIHNKKVKKSLNLKFNDVDTTGCLGVAT